MISIHNVEGKAIKNMPIRLFISIGGIDKKSIFLNILGFNTCAAVV